MSLYVREGWRQTDSNGGEGGRGLHTFSVVWEKEQFIISARLECINCLGCWKFTLYTTTLAALFLMRVAAVELMH